MGTLVHIAASGRDGATVERAIEKAFDAIALVDRLMSFHDRDSELSRLNRDAYRQPQRVHPWTYAVLKRSLQIADASAGLFDITVAPLLVAAGLLPHANDLETCSGNWRSLKLLGDNRLFFEQPVLLDLGGIAKGFAVDQAIHVLRRGGCTEAVVNAGGDLRRYGQNTHPVYLRRNDALAQVAELRCGAVATSSPNKNHPDRIAQPLGCIVNPIDGQSWNAEGSVMVAAKNCMIADALTKVAALVGPTCQPLLDRFGALVYFDNFT